MLKSSKNPSAPGKPVTFTATVSSPQGGPPTGDVVFLDGSTIVARATLSAGTAKFTTKKLTLGLHVITATYLGNTNYGVSTSTPLNQYVLYATATTLSSSPNPSTQGQPVTFTVEVSSSNGTPPNGETVSFMKGKTVLGTGTLTSGTATFTTSTLKAGNTSVKAVYAGDSNFAASTSKPVKQVVNK